MEVLGEDYTKGASFALDTGGSLIKLIYKTEDNDGNKLHVHSIPAVDWEQLIPTLKKLMPGRKQDATEKVHCSGIGVFKFKKQLEEEFNVTLVSHNEFDVCARGILYSLKHCSPETVFYQFEDDNVINGLNRGVRYGRFRGQIGRSGSEDPFYRPPAWGAEGLGAREMMALQGFPEAPALEKIADGFVMVTIGSGTAVNKVTKDGRVTFVELVSRGGRYFIGLGSVIAGKPTSFAELVAMAEEGDPNVVDAQVKDEMNEIPEDNNTAGLYSSVPMDLLLFSFGQANKTDTKRPCDLVSALLRCLLWDIVQLTSHCAYAKGLRHVVYGGSFVGHPYVRRQLAETFLETAVQRPPAERLHYHILENPGYYGVFGCWLSDTQG